MKKIFAALALLCAALPIGRAQSPTLIVSPSLTPASSAGQNFAGTVGELFTVNPGYLVTVSGIGFWDFDKDGVTGSDTVSAAIFTSGGSVVPGTQINTSSGGTTGAAFSASGYTGGTLSPGTNPGTGQFFVYTLSTPVTLSAGNYAIAGWGFANANNYEVNAGAGNTLADFDPLSGAMTLTGSSFSNSAATLPPVSNQTSGASILAATFVASAVPEPSTYAALFGAVALGLAMLRRHRRGAA